MHDWDLPVELHLYTDSSAATGTVNRRGLGKLRHIGVQYLWLHEKVMSGDLVVAKVLGSENPADLCTKHLVAHTMHCRYTSTEGQP